MKLRRDHGDDSVYETCCWIATVVIAMALLSALASVVGQR